MAINLKDFITVENNNTGMHASVTLDDNITLRNNYIGYNKSHVKSLFCDYIKKYHVIASNGYVNIIDIYHGMDDYVLLNTKNNTYKKIYYDRHGNPYFKHNNIKYMLDDFMPVKPIF